MIRRLVAYLTLGIFLLNVLGYYGVFVGAKKLSSNRLAGRLDSEMYDLGGNITIKVPLALPFEVTSEHFSRNDGTFEMDGQVYQVINQRHYNDTLYMVCLKDESTTRLNSILAEYIESFSGHDDGDSQHTTPGLIKDFVSEVITLKNSGYGWVESIRLTTRSSYLIDAYAASIVHPPERVS